MTTFICNKVSKTDVYSQARCLEYIKARHKLIYESFDWKAAQIIVSKLVAPGGGTIQTLNAPEAHHIISVRLDGKLLDPVSPSVIFERETTEVNEYNGPGGTPRFYEEFLDLTTQTRSMRFFPPLADGAHEILILAKAPYNDAWIAPAIPATENALIALATADMWEYLHEVGKAQAKFQEGNTLLQQAQGLDTPGSQRPRRTRRLTATGNSLGELADTVCQIINDFTPEGRNMVCDFIRRNYQQVWQAGAWPETFITDAPIVSSGTAIISHLIDKVIAVRANLSNNLTQASYSMLNYYDSSVILGITPEAFSQSGAPLGYNLVLPVGLPSVISAGQIQLQFSGSEKQIVFIRGEYGGVDVYENLSVSNSLVTCAGSYDTVFTLKKPMSANSLVVKDLGGTTLMTLRPGETNRKYNRIQVLPDYDTTQYPDRSIFVLGKRKLVQLLDEGDSTEITGIENILINSSAADAFAARGEMEKSNAFMAKATAAMKTLIDRVTTQSDFQPRILPYAEPFPIEIGF